MVTFEIVKRFKGKIKKIKKMSTFTPFELFVKDKKQIHTRYVPYGTTSGGEETTYERSYLSLIGCKGKEVTGIIEGDTEIEFEYDSKLKMCPHDYLMLMLGRQVGLRGQNYIVQLKTFPYYRMHADVDMLVRGKLTEEQSIELFQCFQVVITRYFGETKPCSKERRLIVLGRPPARKGDNWKHGFHLHWPEIIVNRDVAVLLLREDFIVEVERLSWFKKLIVNDVRDVIDECIYGDGTIAKQGNGMRSPAQGKVSACSKCKGSVCERCDSKTYQELAVESRQRCTDIDGNECPCKWSCTECQSQIKNGGKRGKNITTQKQAYFAICVIGGEGGRLKEELKRLMNINNSLHDLFLETSIRVPPNTQMTAYNFGTTNQFLSTNTLDVPELNTLIDERNIVFQCAGAKKRQRITPKHSTVRNVSDLKRDLNGKTNVYKKLADFNHDKSTAQLTDKEKEELAQYKCIATFLKYTFKANVRRGGIKVDNGKYRVYHILVEGKYCYNICREHTSNNIHYRWDVCGVRQYCFASKPNTCYLLARRPSSRAPPLPQLSDVLSDKERATMVKQHHAFKEWEVKETEKLKASITVDPKTSHIFRNVEVGDMQFKPVRLDGFTGHSLEKTCVKDELMGQIELCKVCKCARDGCDSFRSREIKVGRARIEKLFGKNPAIPCDHTAIARLDCPHPVMPPPHYGGFNANRGYVTTRGQKTVFGKQSQTEKNNAEHAMVMSLYNKIQNFK